MSRLMNMTKVPQPCSGRSSTHGVDPDEGEGAGEKLKQRIIACDATQLATDKTGR